MIRIEHVSKRYGQRRALSDVSFDLHPGEVTLLLGANGAGKSTLLRCLLGITDYEGSITVAGLDPMCQGCAVRSLAGYMPQTGGLHPDLTVDETLRLYAAIRGVAVDRAEALLDEAGLAGHRAARVGDLSGGMRQRLGFALALLSDPRILILDEPSASLDAASRAWLAGRLRAMAEDGRTVLVSTHAGQELLDIGDRRILLEDGQCTGHSVPHTSQVERDAEDEPGPRRSGNAGPLFAKELRDAIGNRWLIGYAAILGVLGLAAAVTGIDSSSGLGLQAFGRTTATLMNLCLLLSPLVAVLMGASAIAGERERGTLEHLLAQPISRNALLFAKYGGLLVSLTLATGAGFIPAGLMIIREGGPAVLDRYLLFPAIAASVGAAMLGLGFLISVSSRSAVQAQGLAVFTWFGFVLLYDLVLIGALGIGSMPVEVLSAALVANPVDAARVLGVLALEPDLYLIGPAGAFLISQFSRTGTALLLLGALTSWAVVPLFVSTIRFALPRASSRRAARLVRRAALASPHSVSSTEATLS
jgi:ABC-type multidrug transport system ATPase subunit/ABC-type transport system involved in multi-copper enzyme maturation permease subunit